jgi:hypothetical protein
MGKAPHNHNRPSIDRIKKDEASRTKTADAEKETFKIAERSKLLEDDFWTIPCSLKEKHESKRRTGTSPARCLQ